MMGLSEQAAPLPDIRLEGYEYLFTEELHRLRDTEDAVDGAASKEKVQAELDITTLTLTPTLTLTLPLPLPLTRCKPSSTLPP